MRRRRTKHRRIKRWVLVSLALTVGLLAVVCIFLWLLLAHVPWWYRPPHVPEADYSRIRNELLESVSDFGDRLVEGRPFELTLSDQQISEWVTVRSEVWPEADEWIPDFVQGPMVVFEPSRLILAGRVDKSGHLRGLSPHLPPHRSVGVGLGTGPAGLATARRNGMVAGASSGRSLCPSG